MGFLYFAALRESISLCSGRIGDSLRCGYLKHRFKKDGFYFIRLKYEVLMLAIKVFPLFRQDYGDVCPFKKRNDLAGVKITRCDLFYLNFNVRQPVGAPQFFVDVVGVLVLPHKIHLS